MKNKIFKKFILEMEREQNVKKYYLLKYADLQVILCLGGAVFCAAVDHQSAKDKQKKKFFQNLFL